MSSDYINGCISGLLYASVGYPFDTIKSRIQLNLYNLITPRQELLSLIRNEGFMSLYKGFMISGIYIPIGYSMVFGTFNTLHHKYEIGCIQASAAAGITYSLISCPAETIKIRSQTNIRTEGVWKEIIENLSRNNMSIKSLYKGYYTTAGRDILGTVIQFTSYTYFHKYLQREYGLSNVWAAPIAGPLSGVVYWIPTYPIDVIKSNVQLKQIPFHEAVRWIYLKKGLFGFWKGISLGIARTAIVDAMGFTLFEYLRVF
jgi:solute carrier family 25 carnitine/acylcarnitine transporter 20/29